MVQYYIDNQSRREKGNQEERIRAGCAPRQHAAMEAKVIKPMEEQAGYAIREFQNTNKGPLLSYLKGICISSSISDYMPRSI